jgi:hypothetical protein
LDFRIETLREDDSPRCGPETSATYGGELACGGQKLAAMKRGIQSRSSSRINISRDEKVSCRK